MLTIAHAQAMLAVRKMWARVVHRVGASPAHLEGWWPSLSTQCGSVAVGRALLDVAQMLFRLIDVAQNNGQSIASTSAPMRKLKSLIERFVHYVEAADRRPAAAASKKLEKAIIAARSLLDAVAVFSVAPEMLNLRWRRLHAELYKVGSVDASPFVGTDLAAFEARLNRLAAANIGTRLDGTTWRNHIRRSLLRLASPDQVVRIARLERIRADLIYKLAMTSRLERLYDLFPWLAAPHGAFVNCAGGALGALASLLECARRLQIGREQKRELGDLLDESGFSRQRAAVDRLTIPTARTFWTSQVRMAAAAGHGYVAGMSLEHGAFSHATVTAMFGGAYFSPDFPLTAARFGKLGWSLPVALQDPRTVASVQAVEQSRAVMRMNDHDDDLPRCNGMTLKRQLAETIVSVFSTGPAGKEGPLRRQRAVDAAVKAARAGEGEFMTARGATNQLLLSMLLSLEIPADDLYRDAIADNVVPSDLLTGEAARVNGRRERATRISTDFDIGEGGQGIRNDAVKERSMTDGRYTSLRKLAHMSARWQDPPNPDAEAERPGDDLLEHRQRGCDDLLEDLLRGRADLPQLTPVGALALPVLWFAPLIDRQRVHWIADGASIGSAPAGPAAQREGIALQVAKAHAWAPLLYSKRLLTGQSVHIACALFTGRSPITADLELAYKAG